MSVLSKIRHKLIKAPLECTILLQYYKKLHAMPKSLKLHKKSEILTYSNQQSVTKYYGNFKKYV